MISATRVLHASSSPFFCHIVRCLYLVAIDCDSPPGDWIFCDVNTPVFFAPLCRYFLLDVQLLMWVQDLRFLFAFLIGSRIDLQCGIGRPCILHPSNSLSLPHTPLSHTLAISLFLSYKHACIQKNTLSHSASPSVSPSLSLSHLFFCLSGNSGFSCLKGVDHSLLHH